jgi:excisionase family DNA binding protein
MAARHLRPSTPPLRPVRRYKPAFTLTGYLLPMDPEIIVTHAPRPDTKGSIRTHSDEALSAWTPSLGPTAMLLAYRLAGDVERSQEVTYETEALAKWLAVMPSKLDSTLKRLARRGVIVMDEEHVGIHLTLPRPPDTKPQEPLTLSVDETAELLGISRGAAYEAVKSGELPSVRIGRRILVPRAQILALVDGARPTSE